ncbi:L-glutamate gamma-semialdehyde dehydrogenase [Nocardioides sp. MAH-18]|uniref:L-glutamate gamma-semialdehyde dehydrogenase n=1 Tax=Nocardioides agri TaxID=2682843 RepID=A0A6L6XU82_9ACTN|nr:MULTISPECIES: L-glutamate gamma-semialdehyde dehydrogenase [unclassified Nocardioides]MBA2955482.1 L-glutamate gamma-semialdehyde dehydrogenase [Nocardioides sp. CGMCC 1.13656]MVQ50332.1 L-glutamate gamma-semialdehyde dehydrogenase [Nocardioides sp. MAH-18]
MDSVTTVPVPVNEPVRDHRPGSPEQQSLWAVLEQLRTAPRDLPARIGDRWHLGSGERIRVTEPHRRASVLGVLADSTRADACLAVRAALDAAHDWRRLPYDARAAIFLRAADLLSGPWRDRMNAATMLGQGKTVHQAEIDAACELADFWRFNVAFGRELLEQQPAVQPPGAWNRLDHRPLEGFVYAVTPFNFTAIAGNLATAPALMGNVVVWKPAPTQQLSAHVTMELLEAAGLPPGVVNMLPGTGPAVSDAVLDSPHLAGIHFTGSTDTFRRLWGEVGHRIGSYRTYPRIVGETGGKGFVLAHPSADLDELRTALLRGAFDYQGQKCSAASRAYLPRSIWRRLRDDLAAAADALPMGDVTDHRNFLGAVIDERAYRRQVAAIAEARARETCRVIAGGEHDDAEGWFVRPTVLECDDLSDEVFEREYFGPILAVHVFDDDRFDEVAQHIDRTSDYALTGAVFGRDRGALESASATLRDAAGNLYLNDKPTGAVVGQQPFGGGRASGTNDKAGAPSNLSRWISSRTLKETYAPPRDHRYAHMG